MTVFKCSSYNIDEVRVLSSCFQHFHCSVSGRCFEHSSALLLRSLPLHCLLLILFFPFPTALPLPLLAHLLPITSLCQSEGVGCGVKSLDAIYSVSRDRQEAQERQKG